MDMKMIKKGTIGFAALLLVACGGGSGGGGPAPAVYDGIMTQANVDTNNDKTFVDTAYSGSGADGGVSGFFSIQSPTDANNGEGLNTLVNSAQRLNKYLGLAASSGTGGAPTAAVVSVSDGGPGTCGGSISVNATLNDQTGEFSGSMSFANLNECDVVINGSINFSGFLIPDPFTPPEFWEASSMAMNIPVLSISGAGQNITISGSISTSKSGSTETLTMTMDYRDSSNTTYRVEDMIVTTTTSGSVFSGTETVTMSGKVYHPDYGYVVISTQPSIITDNSFFPPSTTGKLVLTGINGTITVTMNGGTDYTIEVDTNNDGTPEETTSCTGEPAVCAVVVLP